LAAGTLQLSDADRIAPKHIGRNIGGIIAGAEDDHLGAGDLPQQTFEIAICRNQDEAVSGGIVQDSAVACASEPVSERTFGIGEQVAQQGD
jgi:hypothetical protein